MRVAINGLGRIGRCLVRAWAKHATDIELVAVNDPAGPHLSAHLLKYDSTHGVWNEDITTEDDALMIAGKRVHQSTERQPDKLRWPDVDLVMECTGAMKNRAQAAVHLQQGAKRVLFSAPMEDADATIVYGVNDDQLSRDAQIISCASCTTNCLAPVAAVLDQLAGIESGWMSTIHAYTNDQRLLDSSHSDLRRARAAGQSVIPTKTGAAEAIGLVLPALSGKLSGMSLRVPVVNVSLVDLTCLLARQTTVADINAAMQTAAAGKMNGVLAVNTLPLVSCDFNGHSASSIFDATQTRITDQNLAKIFSWYDNEWGFSCRMWDIAHLIQGM